MFNINKWKSILITKNQEAMKIEKASLEKNWREIWEIIRDSINR